MTSCRVFHYVIALLVGLTFSFAAAAPSQAALPNESAGPQDFAKCFWLMLTDGPAHAAECGPSQVILPSGFPGTGTSVPPPKPDANCCPCANENVMLIDPVVDNPVVDVADAGHLSPSDLLAAYDEWLVACCPCGPPPV